jgi:hypothetical protein
MNHPAFNNPLSQSNARLSQNQAYNPLLFGHQQQNANLLPINQSQIQNPYNMMPQSQAMLLQSTIEK